MLECILWKVVNMKHIFLYKHNRHWDQSDALVFFIQEGLSNNVWCIVLPIFFQGTWKSRPSYTRIEYLRNYTSHSHLALCLMGVQEYKLREFTEM